MSARVHEKISLPHRHRRTRHRARTRELVETKRKTSRLEIENRLRRGVPRAGYVVRILGPNIRLLTSFQGEVTGTVDDVVLQRGDGTIAYNLAVVVDDAAAGVDQIVRGADLASSTARHVLTI